MRSSGRRKQISIAKMAEEQQESSQGEVEGETNGSNVNHPTHTAAISLAGEARVGARARAAFEPGPRA